MTAPRTAPFHDWAPPTMIIVRARTMRLKPMSEGEMVLRTSELREPATEPRSPLTTKAANR